MGKGDKVHDLHDFMSQISSDMKSEYERIQKRATEDPGTAGDQGEENWATLLREWLPATYKVVTKGRIISHDGKMSPQIDILVLRDSYPKKLLDKKVYLSAGVVAAFECKVTLTAAHIKEAVNNCVKIKSLYSVRYGTPYKELHSPIVYGLLAHSHGWKGVSSKPLENVEQRLIKEDAANVIHPRYLLDILCVADLAVWTSIKMTFIGPKQVNAWQSLALLYGPEGSATTGYIGHSYNAENSDNIFTPIGGLISYLSQKLAWENPEYRSLADYYRITNISGSGYGAMRLWGPDIYSDEIRNRVMSGQLSNGIAWDEWSLDFQ
ncbi:DUF6602 domain-containing protein [Aeromonas hydrophila]|uniref:DUF6602 domain-containing protein n=1 Tax=Aeromonas hydrophila TaxID=644 RepID=UPI003985D0AE